VSRTVFLHIGAPKTGTTYVQDRLSLNARTLAEHGVHFPSRSALVSPGLSQFRAALDLLGQDWGGAPGHAEGSWEALVKRVRRLDGTVVVSHEILSPAKPDKAARAVAELGAGADLHLVYSARDLGRALPAAWQESIKQGRRWRYGRFLRKARHSRTWFARAFDIPSVLGTWGASLPPENLHVVTVPPSGTPRGGGDDPLWLRFCTVFGIDPAWAPVDSDRANKSLGVAETTVLRLLNKRLGRAARREAAYDHLVRQMLAQDELVKRESPRVRLPPRSRVWVDETTERWIEYLSQSGLHVVGDLDDLRPRWPDEGTPFVNPDKVKPRERLDVALDALAAMTREAASRPDPDRQISARLRKNAGRLRGPGR
jgi:hypothetical protein